MHRTTVSVGVTEEKCNITYFFVFIAINNQFHARIMDLCCFTLIPLCTCMCALVLHKWGSVNMARKYIMHLTAYFTSDTCEVQKDC